MKSDFLSAINQICGEKGLSKEVVLQAIEAALASAYRRSTNSPANEELRVALHPQTGEVKVYTVKTVVAEPEDKRIEISLPDARAINPKATLGSTVEIDTTPRDFGRIAAQTAKQVVLQRLREAERDMVYGEYSEREGDIVTGIVQRVEPRGVIIELGRAEALMPPSEQVASERYRPGLRLKVYLLEVNRTNKGPQVMVSRTHRNLVRRLFELEVPEIYNGAIEIKSIAREPGSRSKVAVAARQEGVDPVGSCVGMRGVRIQNVVNELYGEKIDVVQWNPDPAIFVANALSPAQVTSVSLSEQDNTAAVIVPERQLSLAIGKEGQNARLSAKLTGWRIDIRPEGFAEAAEASEEHPEAEARDEEATPETAVEHEEMPDSPSIEESTAEIEVEPALGDEATQGEATQDEATQDEAAQDEAAQSEPPCDEQGQEAEDSDAQA